ncbi:hypothetical protein [Chryseobacterium indoltheticum]
MILSTSALFGMVGTGFAKESHLHQLGILKNAVGRLGILEWVMRSCTY